jgi:Tfp pilus assembly protein PilW
MCREGGFMKICGKQDGFTLVELMIAMVSSAVLALIVALILFISYRSWSTNSDYARLRRDTAFAVQLMAKEIRSSSFSGITVTANSLRLQTNAVRLNPSEFTRSAAQSNLTYSISSTLQGPVISKGLKVFNPQKQTNGVLLHLEMVNADETISITNKTFIFARN